MILKAEDKFIKQIEILDQLSKVTKKPTQDQLDDLEYFRAKLKRALERSRKNSGKNL
jgi:hypothetical protein